MIKLKFLIFLSSLVKREQQQWYIVAIMLVGTVRAVVMVAITYKRSSM